MNDATTTLAYSPCPNDTFIFAAWANGLLPNAPRINVVLDDVEGLNRAAACARYALTKISYGAIPFLTKAKTIGCYERAVRSATAAARSSPPGATVESRRPELRALPH